VETGRIDRYLTTAIQIFLFLQRGGAPLYYDHYLVGPVEEREGNIYVNYNLDIREQKSTKESKLQVLTTLETPLPSLCEIHTYGFITSSTTPIDHQQQFYPDEIHQHRP
jgi:hypothetical protein